MTQKEPPISIVPYWKSIDGFLLRITTEKVYLVRRDGIKRQMQNMTNFFKLQIEQENRKKFLLLMPIAYCLLFEMQLIASAQVVPDNTLPSNSVVTDYSNIIEITGGTTAGSNLFHSFKEFSVFTGGTAFFNNASTIENIISRVTGGSVSNIDGLIRANGNANLFLLNPNGIVFGPNASLNIGGSFISSTANSIKFADGSEFSARNPQTSLLTVNVPLGLQYGSNPGQILVQGSGNKLGLNPQNFETVRNNRPVGLQVQSGQTLALVGGNVTLESGNLTASGGRIELGSVNEGMVKLTPTNPGWSISYQDIRNFQDIRLSQAASVDTSGSGGGDIQVQGRRITLTDGSAILADTLLSEAGGTLSIRASETLEAIGTAANSPFYSGLFTNVASGATGSGGHLTIETGRLLIANGAQIGAIAFGSGNAGNLTVRAQEVELIGGGRFGPSAIFAAVAPGGLGNAAKLTIETGRLRLANGAQVATSTFGFGNAGDLMVRATEVELVDVASNGFFSILAANVEPGSSGRGGNLTIETERLQLVNGAQVSVGTFGSGNAGSLTVRATEIEAIGISLSGPSGLFTSSGAIGNGGNLTIDTQRLRVADGAQIAVSTYGLGNAGKLIVRATDSVELIGTSPSSRSGLLGNAIVGTGNGGDLMISTPKLTLRDGATISASNFSSLDPNIPPGLGKAGNIQIEAGSILLDNTLSDTQGGITASTYSGGGGNIILQVQGPTTVRNGSQISAETKGSGNGGSVNITTGFLELTNTAKISTNSTEEGQAGNITILADQIQSDRGEMTATSNKTGGGDIQLTTDLLLLRQSLISTSVLDSNGGGGNVTIDTDFLVGQKNSDIRANAVFGPGGNIQISTQGIFLSPNSEITASSKLGVDGVVDINTLEIDPSRGLVDLPDSVVDVTGLVAQGCSPSIASSKFIVTGRGGLPSNPGSILSNETVLVDLGTAAVQSGKNDSSPAISTLATNSSPTRIIEAQGWVVDANGQVTLTASVPEVTPHSPWLTNTVCSHSN